MKKEAIKNILERGVEEIISRESLEKRLREGEKLRVKLGIDPTGPALHIGRAFQLWKLRAFQELGHTAVLIIGDFTALIGDASDKQTGRRPLSKEEIKKNVQGYKDQIGKILSLEKTEIRFNSEWLSKIKPEELISLSMKFTAQQMIQRRNFKERWEKDEPIGVHELLYPILQGYDSVMIEADVELGGTDQLFNLKAGRKIQELYDKRPQEIITTEMLYGLDGRKMSTSWGNIVSLLDKPADMYGKIMSIQDELILDYFKLCTRVSIDYIEKVKKGLMENSLHPRDAKMDLAFRIVSLYHGEKEAQSAAENFSRIFRQKEAPLEMEEVKIKAEKMSVVDLLIVSDLVSSRSEARRLIKQEGVKIDGTILKDPRQEISIKPGMVLQVGKRRFKRVN